MLRGIEMGEVDNHRGVAVAEQPDHFGGVGGRQVPVSGDEHVAELTEPDVIAFGVEDHE